MKGLVLAVVVSLFASAAGTSAVDAATLRLASWLVGSFDSRAQAGAAGSNNTADVREATIMTGRPLQDPVVFLDGLYVYVEHRLVREAAPYRQRIYRLTKSGRRIRLQVFRIDARLLGPLASEPQMLNSLAPADLTREEGCDVLLEEQAGEYVGSTGSRSCKSSSKGSAYMTTTLRVTKDLVVSLERGYDEKGIQTFGPTDSRGDEFRRIVP